VGNRPLPDRDRIPAEEFLDSCPVKVEATILAVLEAVRAAPPPAFSGGGKWEAMHGRIGGYYEIRLTGPARRHFRLFCLLDNGTAAEQSATSRRSPGRGRFTHGRKREGVNQRPNARRSRRLRPHQ
jgi:hypothetical protein